MYRSHRPGKLISSSRSQLPDLFVVKVQNLVPFDGVELNSDVGTFEALADKVASNMLYAVV